MVYEFKVKPHDPVGTFSRSSDDRDDLYVVSVARDADE
jgi:hypothetical protein